MVAECFSGECSFCDSCTKTHHYISNTDPNESRLRAEDMSKFFKKDEIQTEFETYHKSITNKMKSYQYIDKSEQGFCPQKVKIDNSDFILTDKTKKCDSTLCQMFHLHLHENIAKRLLTNIPIYKSVAEKHFCLTCIHRA